MTGSRWSRTTRSSSAGWRGSGSYVSLGADGRYTGKQWLRGDEANVTNQLDGYFVADARVGVEVGRWEINGIVTNLFQNDNAIFGTFNINQGNPAGLDGRAVPHAERPASVPPGGADHHRRARRRGARAEISTRPPSPATSTGRPAL